MGVAVRRRRWSARRSFFPAPHLDGKSLHELFETEKVTFSAGVPTVWQALLAYHGGQRVEIFDDESHRDRRFRVSARDDQLFQQKYGVMCCMPGA